MGIIILAMLTSESIHEYKIIADIHKEFEILLSPGSLYPLLHCLEEDKLVESALDGGRIVYHITPAGKKNSEKHPTPTIFPFKKYQIL